MFFGSEASTICLVSYANDRPSSFLSVSQQIPVSMYSFGSPRIFNAALATRYKKLIPDSFRVVADGDVVTGMPPWGYKHVGTVGCSLAVHDAHHF